MKPAIKNVFILISAFWLSGCIQSYDLKVDEQEKLLVVNGLITDEPGPYTVKLSTTFKYGAYFNDIDPSVEDAEVVITDDSGVTEVLQEKRPGVYETAPNGIRGRAGGKYNLKIRLKDGRQYISGTETLTAAPAMDRLYATLKDVQQINNQGTSVTKKYVQFLVDAKDTPGRRDYYRWAFNSTYEITTQPENYTITDKRGNKVPAPKDCCRQCWLYRINTFTNVLDDKQFNGNNLIGHEVAAVPFIPEYFENKYFIEVKQYALSEQAYAFWGTLYSQVSGSGSVHEPAPANAVSNISNIHNPNEQVLGYFGSSGVSKKSLFVEPNSLEAKPGNFVFPDDCRVINGATTNRPSFW